jgi:hypothetical protein
MPETSVLRGSCLCGRVRFAVEDAFDYAMNCHCGQCRRTTGSAFKPMGGIPLARLWLTGGADDLLAYGKDHAQDIHCGNCGSLLYSVVRQGEWAHVAYGSLIDPPALAPQEHIFAADRAPWHQITDGLPQWAGHSGASERLA